MEITVEELNELLQKEFERGKNSVVPNTMYTPYTIKDGTLTENPIAGTTLACDLCSKNPKNGGDGIYHCTLGQQWTTHSATCDFVNTTITGDIKNES